MEKREERLFSNKGLLALIVPLMVTLSLELVVGMIDSVMVSSVGEAAVSGVSLVDSIVQLIIYIFSAMAAGGAIVAGQHLGSRNLQTAKRSAGELMWLNSVIGFIIMLLMILSSDWILRHFFGHIEPDVYRYAGRYMTAVVLSLPAIAIFEAGNAIFRTMSNSKTPMKISLLMNAMNVAGNAILIYGCSMDTLGAAISTVIARWTAAAIVLALLLNPELPLSLERTLRHRFDGMLVRQILSMGIPNGIENGMFQFGKIAIIGLVTAFGTAAITANAVVQTVASIEMIPGSAVQLATITVVSQCIGCGDFEQAAYYNRKLLAVSYVCVAAFSAILVLSLPLILQLYNLSSETSALATSMFLWHVLGGVLLWPLAFNLPASLRASGDVNFPMAVSIFSMWVFRFGGAYLLAFTLGLGAVGTWISMAVLDWGFRSVVFLIRWRGGKWRRMRLVSGGTSQR